MQTALQYLSKITSLAHQAYCRFGVVLEGDKDWQRSLVSCYIDSLNLKSVFQLGGERLPNVSHHVAQNQGQQLLGQESDVLVCVLNDQFDANSFSSVLGTLKGGGLLLVLAEPGWLDCDVAEGEGGALTQNWAQLWLNRAFSQLYRLNQTAQLPSLPAQSSYDMASRFDQQQQAVEGIIRVAEGHRKRPFVLTADRGRGKSSALGIATGQLLQRKAIKVLITAPKLSAVLPALEHAARLLPESRLDKSKLVSPNGTLEFIAPDALLSQQPECDLLLVDEAAAIPIPMLQAMVARYHRAVFATTIHGYEGCGRGFTLKFQSWLKQQRPGARFLHLDQPIRWCRQDYLEQWLYRTFLLDAELSAELETGDGKAVLQRIEKAQLFNEPSLLRRCFGLLVNAHYQTSPNDMMLLLSDRKVELYLLTQNDQLLGCLLTVQEGGLSDEDIRQIVHGERRPKGHMVASTLASQFHLAQAAKVVSQRIMRIAIHPSCQGKGWGSELLNQLAEMTPANFLSTSFGASAELVRFWKRNQFVTAKLAIQRDHASGCHSLIMVREIENHWSTELKCSFQFSLDYLLKDPLKDLHPELIRELVSDTRKMPDHRQSALLHGYVCGGVLFETVAPMINQWLIQDCRAVKKASDLLIYKVLQQHTWQQCAQRLQLPGKKQVEHQLKRDLAQLINECDFTL
ncbi:GNAT family N-acetyltransferase [Vibrio sp.]|uniref:GNAT family N-acetyltransferase n=1 Tax=Vibrio sp. TaxID=678 RepID=UPI003D0F7330